MPRKLKPLKASGLIGHRFGAWVVLAVAEMDDLKKRGSYVHAACDCGTTALVNVHTLVNGRSTRCRACFDRERAEVITYRSAHNRVVRVKGKASEHVCIDCGATASEWAYQHTSAEPWEQELTRDGITFVAEFSKDPDDYAPMCAPCHRRFDRARKVSS